MLPKAPFLFPISNEYCPNTELDMIQAERIFLREKSMIDTLYLFKVYRVICEV